MSTFTPPSPQLEVNRGNRIQSGALRHSTFGLKVAAAFLMVGFFGTLVLPLAVTDFRYVPTISKTEKRMLNAFPAWSWNGEALDQFPAKFEAAFNDHFGFRNLLVLWHSHFKLYCLGVSPVEDVVLGRKKEWLYYAKSVRACRKIEALPKQEVEQWVHELKTKQAWLAARHIRYLLVVAPSKEDIYPEYLPNYVHEIRYHRFFDDILAGLGTDSGVEVLDLRETLRQGKKLGLGPVYDLTDTHWSQIGAFLATNQILLRLQSWFPELQPTPLSNRPLSSHRGKGGDLAQMMGLQDEMMEDRIVIEKGPDSPEAASMRLQTEWPRDLLKDAPMVFETKGSDKKLTLLMTGDSFGGGIMRFLSEHFRRTVRLQIQIPYTPWFQALIPKLVEAEKPDIYLDVYCTRSLKHPPAVAIGGDEK